MRRACMRSRTLHPHGLLDSYSHNGQHAEDTVYRIIRVLPPGILAYKTSSVLHYDANATEEKLRNQRATETAECFSPSDHTTQRAALHIAHCAATSMTHTMQRYSVM